MFFPTFPDTLSKQTSSHCLVSVKVHRESVATFDKIHIQTLSLAMVLKQITAASNLSKCVVSGRYTALPSSF